MLTNATAIKSSFSRPMKWHFTKSQLHFKSDKQVMNTVFNHNDRIIVNSMNEIQGHENKKQTLGSTVHNMAFERFGRHLAQLIVSEVCSQLDSPARKDVVNKSTLVLADSLSQRIIEDALFSVYTISRYKFYKSSRKQETLREEPEESSLDRTSDGTEEAPTLPLIPSPMQDLKIPEGKMQSSSENQAPYCSWDRVLSALCCIKTSSRSNSLDGSWKWNGLYDGYKLNMWKVASGKTNRMFIDRQKPCQEI